MNMSKMKEKAKKAGSAAKKGAKSVGGAIQKSVEKVVPKSRAGRTVFGVVAIIAIVSVAYSIYSVTRPASTGNTPPPPTPPTPFSHPDFYDGKTKLLPQNMWIGVYFQRNDTLVWVNTYSGAASGIPDTAVVPPVGATYTYTRPGFMYFGGSDSGSLSNGAFSDGVGRVYFLHGAPLTSTGHTVVACDEYRNTAASVTVRAMLNNTAGYAIAGANPLKSTGTGASNLSINILPSQNQVDAIAKWSSYNDVVNASWTGVHVVYTGNWTTAALGATYFNVYADGVKLTPTAVTGSTTLCYRLPYPLTYAGVTVNAYSTAAGRAAHAGMTAAATEKFTSGLTPATGATL
jgi:hypothetical protein